MGDDISTSLTLTEIYSKKQPVLRNPNTKNRHKNEETATEAYMNELDAETESQERTQPSQRKPTCGNHVKCTARQQVIFQKAGCQ